MSEAEMVDGGAGLVPRGDGWFVVNVADAMWRTSGDLGSICRFENLDDAPFPEVGINVRVIAPGRANARYHGESGQEAILILRGEALLLVEEQERRLRAWDFVHLPSMVPHVLVGAGDEPCVFLMAGARPDPEEIIYPVSEVALRHGAGVEVETPEPDVAYRGLQRPPVPGRPDGWESLPWGGG